VEIELNALCKVTVLAKKISKFGGIIDSGHYALSGITADSLGD